MLSVAYSIAHKLNSHKGMTLATRNDKIVKVHKLKIICTSMTAQTKITILFLFIVIQCGQGED